MIGAGNPCGVHTSASSSVLLEDEARERPTDRPKPPIRTVEVSVQRRQVSFFCARGHDLVRSDQNPARSAHTRATADLVPGIDLRIDREGLQPIAGSFGDGVGPDRGVRIFKQQEVMTQFAQVRP